MFGLRIFISYRREDTEDTARLLHEKLQKTFECEDCVFLDSSSLRYGTEFPPAIHRRIASSDVMLIVIGPDWLTASNKRGSRLEQPDDWVRIEIEAGIARQLRMIPVCVQGAKPPSESALPLSIRRVARLTMATLPSGSGFDDAYNGLLRHVCGWDIFTQADTWRRVKMVVRASLPVAFTVLFVTWTSALDFLRVDILAQSLLLRASAAETRERVLLVGIDRASEHKLGRTYGSIENRAAWRSDHARLIDRAASAGASAIVFDTWFELPSEADAKLASSAFRAATQAPPTRVVFGVRRLVGSKPDLTPELGKVAQWGSLCLLHSSRLLWSSPLAIVQGGVSRESDLAEASHPSLALAAVVGETLLDANLSRRQLRFDGPPRTSPVLFSRVEPSKIGTSLCLARAGDDQLAMVVRLSPAAYWRDSSRYMSYADALSSAGASSSPFSGRVVLVGRTAGDKDAHAIGLGQRVPFGVELQADAISTLASGRVPKFSTDDQRMWTSAIAFVVGAVVSVASYRKPRWWRRIALVSLSFCWALLAWWFATHDLILNPAYDLLAGILAYLAMRWVQWFAKAYLPLRKRWT